MLATELGWEFETIDRLTMTDVDDVFEYWRDNPPVGALVRAWFAAGREKPKRASKASLMELAKKFGG